MLLFLCYIELRERFPFSLGFLSCCCFFFSPPEILKKTEAAQNPPAKKFIPHIQHIKLLLPRNTARKFKTLRMFKSEFLKKKKSLRGATASWQHTCFSVTPPPGAASTLKVRSAEAETFPKSTRGLKLSACTAF